MNITEYTYLINKPDAINNKQTDVLEKIIQEFPYFQSARAIYLKGLYNQNSFKYNYALKITAAHTTDRGVLFDFITSDTFTIIHKGLYDQKVAEILEIKVNESEIITDKSPFEIRENTVEQSIITSIKKATPIVENQSEVETILSSENQILPLQTVEEKLEIGKPIPFSLTEKHSFQEWLQLSKFKPIVRNENLIVEPTIPSEVNFKKQKKNELIDKFIETSPKIPPVKKEGAEHSKQFEPSKTDNSSLMTETLAKVYLEQKKYQRAIQAYEILILKYPEKSSFFADRILDIKNLQQNNN